MAISTISRMITAEMTNAGLRRSWRHASLHRLRGFCGPAPESSMRDSSAASAPPPPTRFGSVIADPRVENGVQQVDDETHQQVHQYQQDDHADDGRALPVLDAAEDEPAQAVDVEHALGDDRAAHQGAQVGAEEG